MNQILDATVSQEVVAWCAQVRQLREEHARPITDREDPRVAEYVQACEADDHSGVGIAGFLAAVQDNHKYAGRLYFEKCVTLPPAPVSVPEWAVSVEHSVYWPEVHFDFKSEEITIGDVAAYAQHMITIEVEGCPDVPAGTVRYLNEDGNDITLIMNGHPIDFYGASVTQIKQASAALMLMAVRIGERR